MENYYQKKKKNRIDICNICGMLGHLTWEHVPPKSCGNSDSVVVNRIFKIDKSKEKLDSQNGIKYRTICDNCNNNILGSKADVAFNKFYEQVKNFIQIAKSVNDKFVINVNLIQVLKCLFGKLLAIDSDYFTDAVSMSMRKFILENKLDNNLHVYFWIYPYKTTIQTRTHVTKQVVGNKYSTDGIISLLYFYPLAFIVSNQKENLILKDLCEYVDFANPNIDLIITPYSSFNPVNGKVLPFDWLTNTDESIILSGEGYSTSISSKKTTK